MNDDENPWTCESCGTRNGADDEHCLTCDRWRTDEYDPEEENR